MSYEDPHAELKRASVEATRKLQRGFAERAIARPVPRQDMAHESGEGDIAPYDPQNRLDQRRRPR